jgi:hypothetical protein
VQHGGNRTPLDLALVLALRLVPRIARRGWCRPFSLKAHVKAMVTGRKLELAQDVHRPVTGNTGSLREPSVQYATVNCNA